MYKELFSPILLVGHQQFSELVQFGLDQPCDVAPLLPCRYHAEVLWRERNGPWKTLDSVDGRLDSHMTNAAFTLDDDTLEQRRKELQGK